MAYAKLSMKNQIQICQSASDVEYHNNEDVHLSFLFELDQSKFKDYAYLNTSLAIYDSTEQELLDYCETEWFQIGKDHSKLDDSLNFGFGVINQTEGIIMRVDGCEGHQGKEGDGVQDDDIPTATIGGQGSEAFDTRGTIPGLERGVGSKRHGSRRHGKTC